MGPATRKSSSSTGHPKTPKIHLDVRTEEKCFRRVEEEQEEWVEEEEEEGGARQRPNFHRRISHYYEVFVSGASVGDSWVGEF